MTPHPTDHSDSENGLPSTGRLLGIDFGTKRVGIAISTGEQTIASPLEILERRTPALDAKYFRELFSEYSVAGIVVGLPIHLNGDEGQSARAAREYASWLTGLSQLPIAFWDERFTSAVAEDHLLGADLSRKKRKKRLDMLAAQIMLQSFLDARRAAQTCAEPPDADDADLP